MSTESRDSAGARSYLDIIAEKERYSENVGFAESVTDAWLFPFQRRIVEWAIQGGRRAIFADTGLGKMRMELRYADAVCRHTQGRTILFAPLAVGRQIEREADVIGLSGVAFARNPSEDRGARIIVTNYDNLDKWETTEVSGVVLDESSILKNIMGAMRNDLTERFSVTPFRLCGTATPAPNDYTELGNHSEFLGDMPMKNMLATYFYNDSSDTGRWVLRGHAVRPFWDWVASWAVCCGRPSDVSPDFAADDSRYVLPPFHLHKHVVQVDLAISRKEGTLFRMGETSAANVHQEKRLTTSDRAARVAEIVAAEPDEHWLIWCETDYEAEAIRSAVPALVEVSGSMSPDMKADRLLAFAERGGRLLTKPKIGGVGLNFQICARMVFSGASYSYEAFYQTVRRCWRFGQRRDVHVHIVLAFTEQHMWEVVSGKQLDHEGMKAEMFAASRRNMARARTLGRYQPQHVGRLPDWLITQDQPENT